MELILSYLYVSEERALEAGMTHHGTLFGVPAWLCADGEDYIGTPKIQALRLWTWAADAGFEIASFLLPDGAYLESPIKMTRPING